MNISAKKDNANTLEDSLDLEKSKLDHSLESQNILEDKQGFKEDIPADIEEEIQDNIQYNSWFFTIWTPFYLQILLLIDSYPYGF